MQKDDVIYRQDAINALRNRWIKTYHYEGIGEDIAEECEIYLKQVPPAQPKKGRWVLHTYMPHVAYCTICERNSPYNRRWDFCPNCGADMRGDSDG